VAYLVVVGDTVPVVAALFWPGSVLTNRRAVIGLTATLVVLPLCLLKDLSTLAWTSLLSIAADAAFVLIVVVFAPAAAAEQVTTPPPGSLPEGSLSHLLSPPSSRFLRALIRASSTTA
jgi:amino acid permease